MRRGEVLILTAAVISASEKVSTLSSVRTKRRHYISRRERFWTSIPSKEIITTTGRLSLIEMPGELSDACRCVLSLPNSERCEGRRWTSPNGANRGNERFSPLADFCPITKRAPNP
jgi:hypothetical protein